MKILDFDQMPPEEATRPQAEAAIVAWRAIKEERLAADKVAAALKKQEDKIKQWLIDVFRVQKYEGMVIDGKVTGLSPKEVPVCENRELFRRYIIDNDALELLQFRLSPAAIFERAEALEEEIPGIAITTVYDLFNRRA